MKILQAKQVREVDAYTIKNEPIWSINLMERAARGCTNWIKNYYHLNTSFKFFIGSGNNGGDGLAVARQLSELGYNVEVFLTMEKLSQDSQVNLDRLINQNLCPVMIVREKTDLPKVKENAVIIDSLFGSGLSRPVEGFLSEVIKFINKTVNEVIAIDIPSGLFAEPDNKNIISENIVKANHTLTLEIPFQSFMFCEFEKYIGEWHLIPIGLDKEFIESQKCNYFYTLKSNISSLIKKRPKFSHKGNFGHSLLIAGSYGKMGAAILASKAALKSGLGLLTVHIPQKAYEIMQISIPEAMINIDKSETCFTEISNTKQFNSIGIGPGLGIDFSTESAFYKLILNTEKPMVIDADAINILAKNKEWIEKIPLNSIITPHPKEFDRLAGKSSKSYERLDKAIEFAEINNIIIVLKGAHTAVINSNGDCYFNSTGNPGMATAGSGDVLTGMILSFLSQNYSPLEAALIGVYIHGLSGDFALNENSYESLIAGDLISNLPNAFKSLK